jgi:hypothetical protein
MLPSQVNASIQGRILACPSDPIFQFPISAESIPTSGIDTRCDRAAGDVCQIGDKLLASSTVSNLAAVEQQLGVSSQVELPASQLVGIQIKTAVGQDSAA